MNCSSVIISRIGVLQIMIWNPFGAARHNKILGIDIGTFSIKIVELSRQRKRKRLENYGELETQALYKKEFRGEEDSAFALSGPTVAKAITAIMEEAGIKTTEAYFSIPDFSTFFTSFELPPMKETEVPQAVFYEARQHIPLPLSEVALDWSPIARKPAKKGAVSLTVLLAAVPNRLINRYQNVATASGLELKGLEAEVFALSRSSIQSQKETTIFVDIGARTTTVSVVEEGNLRMSHSFDVSANEMTTMVAKSLNVDYDKANELKERHGLQAGSQRGEDIRKVLLPLVDSVIVEVQKLSQSFYQGEEKEIDKIILAGGSALLPGLQQYVQRSLHKKVVLADPFSNIFYPPILEETLRAMGPSYAIAVGLCLRGFQ